MIEIIYNEPKKGESYITIKPPKNIRQIRSPRGRHKIYVEDYVYTFLHSSAYEGESAKRAAVLLGRSETAQDIRYTFVSGAVSCEAYVFQGESIQFNELCWEYIFKEIKKNFENQEIIGWFLGMPGCPLDLTPMIEGAHRKYFAGREKILLISDPEEGEEVFFAYDQGVFQKKEGYYIYYEKNPFMQAYMADIREKQKSNQENVSGSIEGQDRITSAEIALQNYRKELLEKPVNPSGKKNMFLYTAASAAMLILCVIGVTTLSNYEKMRQVEEAIATISKTADKWKEGSDDEEKEENIGENAEENTEEIVEENTQEVVIESVPGNIEPETSLDETESETISEKENQETEIETQEEIPPIEETVEEIPETEDTKESSVIENAVSEETSAQTYFDQGYYVVQPGDKLELVCLKLYQNTKMIPQICELNGITDANKIQTGQKLILP